MPYVDDGLEGRRALSSERSCALEMPRRLWQLYKRGSSSIGNCETRVFTKLLLSLGGTALRPSYIEWRTVDESHLSFPGKCTRRRRFATLEMRLLAALGRRQKRGKQGSLDKGVDDDRSNRDL